jgi:hypothetical protein
MRGRFVRRSYRAAQMRGRFVRRSYRAAQMQGRFVRRSYRAVQMQGSAQAGARRRLPRRPCQPGAAGRRGGPSSEAPCRRRRARAVILSREHLWGDPELARRQETVRVCIRANFDADLRFQAGETGTAAAPRLTRPRKTVPCAFSLQITATPQWKLAQNPHTSSRRASDQTPPPRGATATLRRAATFSLLATPSFPGDFHQTDVWPRMVRSVEECHAPPPASS